MCYKLYLIAIVQDTFSFSIYCILISMYMLQVKVKFRSQNFNLG